MPDIIHRIGIRAPAAQVYAAVTTPAGIAGWWTRDTAAATGDDPSVTVTFRKHDGSEIGQMEFGITRLDPDREAHWRMVAGPPEWIGTDVTFRLAEADGMTILNFGHRNWREPVEFMGHCSMKWAVFLMSLKAFVERGAGQPSPDDVKIDDWN